jgi:hypothetical protein
MALREGSLVSQIATLDVGESFSRTTMVPFKARGVREDIAEAKRRLRNHLNKHQERATKASGNTYRLDTGVWMASEDATPFVTVSITRII